MKFIIFTILLFSNLSFSNEVEIEAAEQQLLPSKIVLAGQVSLVGCNLLSVVNKTTQPAFLKVLKLAFSRITLKDYFHKSKCANISKLENYFKLATIGSCIQIVGNVITWDIVSKPISWFASASLAYFAGTAVDPGSIEAVLKSSGIAVETAGTMLVMLSESANVKEYFQNGYRKSIMPAHSIHNKYN